MRGRDRAALVGAAVTLAFAGALLGGSTRFTACAISAIAIGAASVHLTSRRIASTRGPLLGLLIIATALTSLQLLPLPEAIAEILARPKLDLVRDNARALDESDPNWVVATFDPPATLVELAKLCGYLAMGWLATRVASQRQGRPWLAAAVVISALLVVTIAAVHYLVGEQDLYGTFEMPAGISVASPVINPNHVASLSSITAVLAIGLAVAWSGARRVAALTAGLVLSAATLLTGSRGGALALAAGAIILVILLVAQRRLGAVRDDRPTSHVHALTIGVVVLCVVTLLGLLAASDVRSELGRTTVAELHEPRSKYQIWTHSLDLIRDNHWLGVGRGGFESSFQRVAPVGDASFSHAENSFLQVVIDWGIPGAAALALALLAFARLALKRWRQGPLEGAALAALGALAVHELADFSLELPVIALSVIAIAALLVPARVATSERSESPRGAILSRGVAIGTGFLVVALGGSPLGDPAAVDREEIAGDPTERRAAARRSLERHPSDALAAGKLAQALFDERDTRAVAVLNRALILRPKHSGLHHLAARLLTRSQRPKQAKVEFALALEWADNVEPILDDVLTTFPEAADAAEALPRQVRQIWRLRDALTRRERHDVTFAYLQRMAVSWPNSDVVQLARAQAAVIVGERETALEAGLIATRLKSSAEASIALARAQSGVGDVRAAIETLRRAPSGASAYHRHEIAIELSTHLRGQGDLPAARDALVDAIAAVGAHPSYEATLRRHLALVEDVAGNAHQAAWERQRADELMQPP